LEAISFLDELGIAFGYGMFSVRFLLSRQGSDLPSSLQVVSMFPFLSLQIEWKSSPLFWMRSFSPWFDKHRPSVASFFF